MPIPTTIPAGISGTDLLDLLDRMDDDTLDALSELLDLEVSRTATPVVVLPREPHTLH